MPFGASVWTAATPIRFAGAWFSHVMTVVQLADRGLLLHSPCRPSPNLVDEIARLGSVTNVVAPNWFHDLYLDEYRTLYPGAVFWGPALLRRQRKSLVDRVLDGTDRPSWFAELPYVSVPGLLSFDECLFLHSPTRTLMVADLLTNASAGSGAPMLTKLGYRLLGLDGRLKVFPILRWCGAFNRTALQRAADQIFEWDPQRLIVGHGSFQAEAIGEQLRAAFRWLKTGYAE